MTEADGAPAASPRDVHAYHCLCSHLVLASTRALEKLPRRTTLDKAYILPLPPPPRADQVSTPEQLSEYALLLSAALEQQPVIIRCSDGFEKRYLYRCGRCGVVVGYKLDKLQYEGEKELGIKDDVVYLLPGGLWDTKDMANGKDMSSKVAFEGLSATASGR